MIRDLGPQHIVGYPVHVESVLAGALTHEQIRAVFNIAPQSQPIGAGTYVLFLLPADTGAETDYVVAYGIRGAFHVDAKNFVHPVCINSNSPGHPVDGDTSASLASFAALVSGLTLAGPPAMVGVSPTPGQS